MLTWQAEVALSLQASRAEEIWKPDLGIRGAEELPGESRVLLGFIVSHLYFRSLREEAGLGRRATTLNPALGMKVGKSLQASQLP